MCFIPHETACSGVYNRHREAGQKAIKNTHQRKRRRTDILEPARNDRAGERNSRILLFVAGKDSLDEDRRRAGRIALRSIPVLATEGSYT